MKVGVIVRVHDRMEDLEICLSLIRKHWIRHAYCLVVASNGVVKNIAVPPACRALADRVVEIDSNPGHRQGSGRLITEGLNVLDPAFTHAVLLEADTWVFSDAIVDRYLKRLRSEEAVWAAAEWIEKYHSLALDFAITDTAFLRDHPEILDFSVHAECHICNTIRSLSRPYLLIREAMPVHLPKLLRTFVNLYGGRRRSFPGVPMVTHHLEDLAGGLETKKALANETLGRMEFPIPGQAPPKRALARLRLFEWILKIFPRSRWFRRKTRKEWPHEDSRPG